MPIIGNACVKKTCNGEYPFIERTVRIARREANPLPHLDIHIISQAFTNQDLAAVVGRQVSPFHYALANGIVKIVCGIDSRHLQTG